jgi:hypothetical protein
MLLFVDDLPLVLGDVGRKNGALQLEEDVIRSQ